jgi:hypothetical protein
MPHLDSAERPDQNAVSGTCGSKMRRGNGATSRRPRARKRKRGGRIEAIGDDASHAGTTPIPDDHSERHRLTASRIDEEWIRAERFGPEHAPLSQPPWTDADADADASAERLFTWGGM